MTSKVYKTAQGKTVDLGTIMLQNEHVRAVGNMNVNARGDRLDSNNQVIETKNRQIQKQNNRTTTMSSDPVHTSTSKAKKARAESISQEEEIVLETESTPVVVSPTPVDDVVSAGGGLAAAIARSKIVKQEKEKTLRQMAQSTPGVRKI